ncbi:MAG: hypothetical protein V3U76_06660 [Granulosicoccus sp.]
MSNVSTRSNVSRLAGVVLAVAAMVSSTQSLAQATVDSDISIVKGESAQITGVDDWVIGVFLPTDTISVFSYQWDPECVFTSTGSYSVELNSQNGGSDLTLKTAAGDEMKYELWIYYFRNSGNILEGWTTPVKTISNMKGSLSPTCADTSGRNLWFAALVRAAEFNPAVPGIYQDLMTITVSPE